MNKTANYSIGIKFLSIISFMEGLIYMAVSLLFITTIFFGGSILTYKLSLIISQQTNFPIDSRDIYKNMALFLMLLGLVLVKTSIGLWKSEKWSWFSELLLRLTLLIDDSFQILYSTNNMFSTSIIINVIIIIFLFRNKIMRQFNIAEALPRSQ